MADQGDPRPVQRTRDADPAGRHDNGSGSGRNGAAVAVADAAPTVGSGLYPRRPAFGALDLGTNNCRLLIARPDGDDFIIVDAFSRIVRLGEGLAASGRISNAAMDRAVDALRICADKLSRRRVLLSRAVATEACRQAVNGDAFIDRVRAETGILLDIISAEEEARLAVMGCHQLMSPGDTPGLVFDIGGGSTELVLVDGVGREPQILDWVSIPWGVVSLTEAHRHDTLDPVARAEGYAVMRAAVRPVISRFAERLRGRLGNFAALPLRILGTSGTVTTLASLHLGLSSYDRSRVDGITIASGDLRHLCARLADLPMPERERLACVGKERADLVVSGCAVLEEILDMWPAEMVNVADRGIREGVLRGLMRAHTDRERGA